VGFLSELKRLDRLRNQMSLYIPGSSLLWTCACDVYRRYRYVFEAFKFR